MHQGQMASLEDVIDHYSTFREALPEGHHRERILQPLDLDAGARADLVAFLRSLTGEALPRKLELPPLTPEYHGDHRSAGP
jgi:cytochrome c peroxidase